MWRASCCGATTALLLAAAAPSARAQHWSDVDFAKCETHQGIKWEIEAHGSGADVYMNLVDSDSGRCLAIKDCKINKDTASDYGRVVVEPCTSSNVCGGKNQHWRFRDQHASPMLLSNKPPVAPSAIENGFEGLLDTGTHYCMCDVFSPAQVDNTKVNVAAYCGAGNSQFKYDPADKTIRLRDPQHFNLGQCLHAKPCNSHDTPPCSLPTSWGTVFVVLFSLGAALYIGGGVAHGVKNTGQPLGPRAHPHFEMVGELRGLVEDGVSFTRARMNGDKGAPSKGLLGPDTEQKKEKKETKEKKTQKKEKEKERADEEPRAATASGGGSATAPASAPDTPATGTPAGGGGRWQHFPA
jgi:hypothetical protein